MRRGQWKIFYKCVLCDSAHLGVFVFIYCRYKSKVSKIISDINFEVARAVIVQSDTVAGYRCFGVHFTSTLKMEVVFSSETLVSTYNITRCQKPEDHNLEDYRY
jgi:hypothetical protein